MLLFYIISIILSLYVGVLFFRKWNLKRVRKSDKELEEFCKNNNTKSYYLSYDDKYKLVPIGLPLWGLFLIILVSFIPVVNFVGLIILTIILFVTKSDYDYTFVQIFGKEYKIIKIINNFFKILNKKI